jgi:hypothetical protein
MVNHPILERPFIDGDERPQRLKRKRPFDLNEENN